MNEVKEIMFYPAPKIVKYVKWDGSNEAELKEFFDEYEYDYFLEGRFTKYETGTLVSPDLDIPKDYYITLCDRRFEVFSSEEWEERINRKNKK